MDHRNTNHRLSGLVPVLISAWSSIVTTLNERGNPDRDDGARQIEIRLSRKMAVGLSRTATRVQSKVLWERSSRHDLMTTARAPGGWRRPRGVTARRGARCWRSTASGCRRMVALRLDRRLQGRVDPSDVIQDAYLEAARRLPEYIREPAPMPLFLWLRYPHRPGPPDAAPAPPGRPGP